MEQTAKAVLELRCAHYGLATTGPKNSLAERIFTYFNGPQSSEGSCNMEDASFVIAEADQEHGTQQEAAPKSNSVPTNKGIVGVWLQELCAVIRLEVSNAMQRPATQYTTPPLSPASAAAIQSVQEAIEV